MFWFCTVPLALCGLASMIAVLRVIGFRLITFAPTSDQEIELATGRNLNEWFDRLNREGADQWKFADIMAFVRSFGFEYELQKKITTAYEKSLGRRAVLQSSDGRDHQIAHDAVWQTEYWADRWGRNRFTVAQTLCWSVSAAILFAFFSYFSSIEITSSAIVIGLPFLVVMAILSIAMLQIVLGLQNRLSGATIGVAASVLAITMLPLAIGNAGLGVVGVWIEYYALLVAAMGGVACWMMAGLFLFRSYGYRLVRVQTAPTVSVHPIVGPPPAPKAA